MQRNHRISRNARPRRGLITIMCFTGLIILSLLLSYELHYPEEIAATPVVLPQALRGQEASGLIIQHVDHDATIWSVAGYCVYKSSDGQNFKRAFKVPSGSMMYWLGNLHSVRRVSGYVELCEVVPLRSGAILAFAGGYLWRSTDGGGSFSMVHKVDKCGIRRGRGIMPEALVEDKHGVIYYGEYHRNYDLEPVHIHRSLDNGITWDVAYRFGAGDTRHIHSLTVDPYTDALWVTTGDRDEESMIAYSVNRGQTFHTVGTGSQQWRTVDLLFTEDSVYWGTDSPESQNWICRLDRDTLAVERLCKVDGPIYYATSLCDGTLVMGSAAEGGKGEWDDVVSVWLSKNGRHWKRIPLAKRKTARRQAVIRFAKGRSLPYILATPLNTEVFSQAILKLDISADLFSSATH